MVYVHWSGFQEDQQGLGDLGVPARRAARVSAWAALSPAKAGNGSKNGCRRDARLSSRLRFEETSPMLHLLLSQDQ